jgi:hypothetical protein
LLYARIQGGPFSHAHALLKRTTAASGRKELFLIEEDLVPLADRWLNEEGNGEKYWKTKQRRRGLAMWGVDKDTITTTVRRIFVAQWR